MVSTISLTTLLAILKSELRGRPQGNPAARAIWSLPLDAAFACLQRRIHPALGGTLSGKPAGRGHLQQLQGAVEIRLPGAVGTDEDAQASDGESDRARRPIPRSPKFPNNESHLPYDRQAVRLAKRVEVSVVSSAFRIIWSG